jgi:transposase
MPARFVDLDLQTPMFLPYDLQEWVPAGHIVHFILDAVEQLPTTDFRVNERGKGSEQYPPRMMLALLIYCYGPLWFPDDRGGELQRRGGALFLLRISPSQMAPAI